MAVKWWGGTRQGDGRDENQDCFGADAVRGVFVVSDGMGGHAAGAEAARAVVDSLLAAGDPGETRALSRELHLRRRVLRAHRRTRELAARLGHQGDMGATVICLWLRRRRYLLAAVGDSRGYLRRRGSLVQLSRDQTLVSRLVRDGLIAPQEARSHPQRNIISQAMGIGSVEPEIFEGELRSGDRLVLLTDGVSGPLRRTDLAELMGRRSDPAGAGKAVLRRVADMHGEDDATVVVVDV